jgi:hypothetical protein
MKKVTLNTANTKKLELKKTAIANLQMSDEQLRILVGGILPTDNASRINDDETNCTIRTHTKPTTA